MGKGFVNSSKRANLLLLLLLEPFYFLPFIQIQYTAPLAMNKVLVASRQQLKCNFCTQWFSVSSEFATMQRYSLNACAKCFQQFHHRIIHPQTNQVYQIVFMRTGISLDSPLIKIKEDFQQVEKIFHHQGIKNLLKDYQVRKEDVQVEIQQNCRLAKEKMCDVNRNFFKQAIANWNKTIDLLQRNRLSLEKSTAKLLSNLKKPGKSLAKEEIEAQLVKEFEIMDDLAKKSHLKFTGQPGGSLKHFLQKYIKDHLGGFECGKMIRSYEGEGKQNITPNIQKKLRNIRERVISKQNKILPQDENKNSRQNSLGVTVNRNQRSRRKSALIETGCTTMKRQSSQKSLLEPKTPRPFHLEFDSMTEYSSSYQLDDFRDQISRLLKQKQCFKSFMPVEPSKEQSIPHKTYGEKALIEELVQLKMKTNINQNSCELFNANFSKANSNICCYMKSLQWQPSISILKLVKVNLHDHEFDSLLHCIQHKSQLQVLVLTNNMLTELSVGGLLEFCRRNGRHQLKDIYLGNNFIKHSKVKKQLEQLREYGLSLHL